MNLRFLSTISSFALILVSGISAEPGDDFDYRDALLAELYPDETLDPHGNPDGDRYNTWQELAFGTNPLEYDELPFEIDRSGAVKWPQIDDPRRVGISLQLWAFSDEWREYSGEIDNTPETGSASILVNARTLYQLRPIQLSNTRPTIEDLLIETDEDTPKTITLSATDADGDQIAYEVLNSTKTTTALTGDQLTITPLPNENGEETIGLQVADEFSKTQFHLYLDIVPVNDTPYWSGDPTDIEMDLGNSQVIDYTSKAADIDTPLENLVAKITGLTQFNVTENGLTPTIESIGDAVTETATLNLYDGDKLSESRAIQITANGIDPTYTNTTFTFHELGTGATQNTGNFTIQYQELDSTGNPVEALQTVTDTDGVVNAQFKSGVEYQVHGFSDLTYEASKGQGTIFAFYRDANPASDDQVHEQRDRNDRSSILTGNGLEANVNVYNMEAIFPFSLMYNSASKTEDGVNRGIRTFEKGTTVPIWYDMNHLPPSAEMEGWLQELVAELNGLPLISNTFVYMKGTEAPSVPHIRNAVFHGGPSPGGNTTLYDKTTHIISRGEAEYDAYPGEYTTDIENLQAILDLNDLSGADPNILDIVDGKTQLNYDGRAIFNASGLADTKNQW